MTTNKTKNFKFNIDNTNLLESSILTSNEKNNLGRPKKKKEEKLSEQVTLKFKPEELRLLKEKYKEHANEYSFANFLRLSVIKQNNIN